MINTVIFMQVCWAGGLKSNAEILDLRAHGVFDSVCEWIRVPCTVFLIVNLDTTRVLLYPGSTRVYLRIPVTRVPLFYN